MVERAYGERSRRRWVARLGMALALVMTFAACSSGASSNGEDKKTPETAFSDAKTAMTNVSSFHIAGSVKQGPQSIVLDVVFSKTRSGGTLTLNGAKFSVVNASGTLYMQGDAAAWTKLVESAGSSAAQAAAAGTLFGGKWIKVPVTNADFGALAGLADRTSFLGQLKATGTITKGAATTVNGKKALTLIDSADNGKILIALTGPAYVLEILPSGQTTGTLTVDQFGTAVPPVVPSGALDFEQLTGGAGASPSAATSSSAPTSTTESGMTSTSY